MGSSDQNQGILDAVAELVAPRSRHDDLSFDELANIYSFHQISTCQRLFVRLVIKELERCSRPATVLDIGSGQGIGGHSSEGLLYLRAVRSHSAKLWGIDPDPASTPDSGILDHFQVASMETAEIPPNTIDFAYSFHVMEHVRNPEMFLKALNRCLRPDGRYLFATPNGRHLFGYLTRMSHRMKVDEFVLRRMTKKEVDRYHYPVEYRFNTPRQITRSIAGTGFESCELAYAEAKGALEGYFVGPMRILYALLCLKRKAVKNPGVLLHMFGRMTKESK